MSFLNSVLNNSKKYDDPFKHWELNKPLTEEQINEIVQADIANPCLLYTSPSPRDRG